MNPTQLESIWRRLPKAHLGKGVTVERSMPRRQASLLAWKKREARLERNAVVRAANQARIASYERLPISKRGNGGMKVMHPTV